MTSNASGIGIFRSLFELFGIVLVRFRPTQRIWGAWLVAVNAACLLFIQHIEAQMTLGAVGVAVIAQALIYQRKGFIRLLGVTHVLWVPMLTWIALRLDTLPKEEALRPWRTSALLRVGTMSNATNDSRAL
jgi:hypothetical protein